MKKNITAAALFCVALSVCLYAADPVPVSKPSGYSNALVSVKNISVSTDFYTRVLGFDLLGQGTLNSFEAKKIWPYVPSGTTVTYSVLQKGSKLTKLTLLEFSKNTGIYIRDGASKSESFGIFDIALRVADFEKTEPYLKTLGYAFLRPPFVYQAKWTGNTVKEGVLLGPDGVRIAMIQRVNPPQNPPLSGNFGEMTDTAVIVHSIDECAAFFRDALCMDYTGDMVMEPGELDDFLSLPENTTARIAFFLNSSKTAEYAPIELLEFYGMDKKRLPGEDLSRKVKNVNLGNLAIGIRVENIKETVSRMKIFDYRVLTPIQTLKMEGLGKVSFAYVEAPGRFIVRLEQYTEK